MNDIRLARKLNSVGKRRFVECFDLLKQRADGEFTHNEARAELVKRKVSNKAGAGIRVGSAKLIFEEGGVRDALSIIMKSTRVPQEIVARAGELLRKLVG